jgi:hypothetical protein
MSQLPPPEPQEQPQETPTEAPAAVGNATTNLVIFMLPGLRTTRKPA